MGNPVISEKVSRNFFKLLETTSTNLGISETYTSSVYSVEEFTYIKGTCKADQDGELIVEFSHDGTNFNGEVSHEYDANDPLSFEVPICAKYMRCRFVNGSVAQGDRKSVV